MKQILSIILIIINPIIVFSQKKVLEDLPKVDVTVKLVKDTILAGDDILLNITLTNNTSVKQKLLFDKPESTTGGPWYTSGSIVSIETGKSVLRYSNKAILESQLYIEDQLKDKYYVLDQGKLLSRQYSLFDIVVTNFSNYRLASGTYEIQLFYCNNFSNKLVFFVK